MKRHLFILSLAILVGTTTSAQTDYSLFFRRDSVQVSEIVSEQAVQYKYVGHHGPAVENSHMALRLYFNDSGAIDLYSKNGKQMELAKYLWYPTEAQQAEEGAGCDEYKVGKTVGLGGYALWDGEKEVKLTATRGRTARVGSIKNGSFAEIIAYGVPYKEDTVDVSIRIEVYDGSREAKLTASELSGKKLQFLTGVNFHEGEDVEMGRDYIAVWGVHPADVSQNPRPIGAGMKFKTSKFSAPEQTEGFVRIISRPSKSVSTIVIGASTKEDDLNTSERFMEYFR